jgi:hypothetical protein
MPHSALLLVAHLCSSSLATAISLRRRLSWGTTPPSPPLRLASASSPSRRLSPSARALLRPPSSSPLLSCYSEPLSTQSAPIESLGAGLAPRQHLPRTLTVGWSESVGEPSASKVEEASPVLAPGLKGFVGWAVLHSGQAQWHSAVF